MPKLNFEPAFNKIGEDDYIVVPKAENTEHRCAIRCNGFAKEIIEYMWPEHTSRAVIKTLMTERHPELTAEEISEEVEGVIKKLVSSSSQSESGGAE